MDERLRFVARLLEGEKMAPLCRQFGISRVTDLSEILCVRRDSRVARGEAIAIHHSELAHGCFPVVSRSYFIGEHVTQRQPQ